jgi:AcrR family transcriptional regulator
MNRVQASRRAAPSPRAGRRLRELALRREDVIAAASQIFSAKGFHAAQMSEIAARAELSLASVYQLFASKDELFDAVISTAAEKVEAAVRARVDATPDPREKLLAVSDALFACFEQNLDVLRIYARATQGMPWRTRGELGEAAQRVYERVTGWVIELARGAASARALRGLDPETLALALIGAVMSNATRAAEAGDAAELARLAPRVRELFARVLA